MIRTKKGITMISIIISVIILLILSTIIIYSIKYSRNAGPYNNLVADITLLEDKILIYFNKNGELPVIDNTQEIINNNEYKQIDLNKLEDLTLNYGTDKLDANDRYLVNNSLEIYYKKGIEKAGTVYHTI